MVDAIHKDNRIPIGIDQSMLNINNQDIEDIITSQDSCPACGKKFDEKSLKLTTKAGMLACIKFFKER